MLIQFNFKNFKSFKDDTTLDMSATKIIEYNDRIIEIGNEKILPVAAIYGANASGKSNTQQAFSYMVEYVLRSFSFGGDAEEKKGATDFIKPTPFLFDKTSRETPSLYEVYFMTDEKENYRQYNYGFTVDSRGVCEEWLNTRAKTSRGSFKPIFYRNRETGELDLNGLPIKTHNNIITSLQKETLIVSLGAKLKIDKLTNIRKWFTKHEISNFGDPVESLLHSRVVPDGFCEDEKVRRRVVEYFASFDESIVDFIVENEEGEYLRIDAVHEIIESNDTYALPLEEESAGTLKMFALYPAFHYILESGGVLFVDELNSKLHPLLLRNFLINFLDPKINKNHAQIIFTTHDTWTLSNNLLRRDEIWFSEKDKHGVSSLFSLADFKDIDDQKIRKDENYEKNYLLGKYGAIPELKPLIICDEE